LTTGRDYSTAVFRLAATEILQLVRLPAYYTELGFFCLPCGAEASRKSAHLTLIDSQIEIDFPEGNW
jgi:hypothetical protein